MEPVEEIDERAADDGMTRDAAAAAAAAEEGCQQLRELIARAHPDTVAELIQGTTLTEMLASLPAARAAYARVAEATRGQAPTVPAGAATRTSDPRAENLSPLGKIRVGLEQRP